MVKSANQLLQEEKDKIDRLRLEKPELFMNERAFEEDDVLPNIGITSLEKNRPAGYIRFQPQDFIVEEMQLSGEISCIEPKEEKIDEQNGSNTLFADLIKIGIPTIEATSRLANSLQIPVNKIGYAGIKDARALTSQKISISKIKYENLKDKKFESFFLSNFYYDKGSVEKSHLAGNRFTIFVRTENKIEESYLKEKLTEFKNNGILNYYQTQRFGGIRLMSHILGKLILQKKYERTIEVLLTEPGLYDIPIIINVREKAKKYYGDWKKMKNIFSELPRIFQVELRALEYLIKNNDNFIGALIHIQDQTTLWVYAYASLLFNRYLSENPDLNKEIPLLLSDKKEDRKIYQKWLDKNKILNIEEALFPFKFIKLQNRPTPTKIFPEDIMFMSTSAGVIVSFFLPKGAYATTFLTNLFKLREGNPVPEWINPVECDTKKLLKIGTCEPALEILKDYI
ncbi:MAG: tRNA pseudouridine(13) synthase TruD [Patescibacteria group bacterium]